MTDDVTNDIFWIQGVRMPWFDTRLGHLKKEKVYIYVCVIYLIYYIYSIYLIFILYILYITYICRVKSVCYINRTSFTSYIG